MATIKYDGIVGEARGAVGTTVYSRNQYGAYVKNRSTPTNPSSTRQVDWRTRLSNAVAAWQALTEADRNLFIAQAKTFELKDRVGNAVKITGYNLFIRQQLLASKSGALPLVGAPFAKLTDVYRLISLALTSTTFTINITSSNVPADCELTIKASPGRGSGKVSFNPSTVILISEASSPASGAQAIDITAAYVAQHGAIAGLVGQYVTIGIQTFNSVTGERSKDFFLSQIVTA